MRADLLYPTEFNPYYGNYINQASAFELMDGLETGLKNALIFYNSIPEEKFDFRYAEGKWTIKELLHHVIDAERVFAYRALRVARGDKENLLGFSQDDYVENANSNARSKEELINEFKNVRQTSIDLYRSFDEAMLLRIGSASDSPISTRALGFIIIGHEIHHASIVKERYL